jgi:hypothetical protein
VVKGRDELHELTLVTSCWLLSLNVAVAVYCCWFSHPMVAVAGLNTTETGCTLLIVNTLLFVTPPMEAEITAVPAPSAVATPFVGGRLLMFAELHPRQAHCTVNVKSLELPSE